jgi:hypothetical protein
MSNIPPGYGPLGGVDHPPEHLVNSSPRVRTPQLVPLFNLHADLAEPLDFGMTPVGHRRVINILGGGFEGARVGGVILAGGADWQIIQPNGVAVLDARYTLRSHDAQFIQVTSLGMRHGPAEVMQRLARGEDVDPNGYYFRTVLRFESGSGPLDWMNRIIAVAAGIRTRSAVDLEAYEVT